MRPVVLVCLCVLCMTGCGRSPDTRTWPDNPSPPQGDEPWGGKSVPTDQVCVVRRREAEAIGRFESSPWVEVTPEEAGRFLDKPVGGDGGRLVMLRAWTLDGFPNFDVCWKEGVVFVAHIGQGPL